MDFCERCPGSHYLSCLSSTMCTGACDVLVIDHVILYPAVPVCSFNKIQNKLVLNKAQFHGYIFSVSFSPLSVFS